jgi:hypothetical protein
MLQSRLILLTALCLPTFIFAQVGIGVSNPDVSAKLEVSATDKGILIPRVALTATNTAGPISSPATGLLVYNTAAINGVTPGFYYWDGTVWVRLITPSDNVANVTGTVAVANGGTGATTAAGAISNLGVIASSEKGANNGVATLGSDGKVPSNQIPSVSFQSANVVASQSAMLTLSTAVAGSIAIRTDVSKNFVLSATPASTLGNWIELAVPTSVTSVNGNSGPSVSLTPGSLGATTLGNNLFTLSDPGAVTFPRFNANNTVSALNAADFRTAIGAGTGSGTVTSVGLSLPNIFSVTNSPVTGSGTLTGALATQNANRVFAGPTTGSAAAPTFRSLVAADIPTLNQNTTGTASNVTGIVAVANGGTGLSSLSTGITTFLGSASSANLASALTDETGSAGSLVFSSNPTFQTITVASGSSQYPSSIAITPTMHASSKRAAVWVDGWSLLQDVQGNGTKDFSIGQTTGTPATYPSRLYINTSGNIGIGNTQPNARLDIRTSPTNTSDPGAGYFGVGTTSAAANTAGAGTH